MHPLSPMPAPTITLLYFAAVRDLCGLPQETLALPASPLRVRDLRALLEQRHPALQGRLHRVRFARNEAFAAEDSVIEPGDAIAVIPPVGGG